MSVPLPDVPGADAVLRKRMLRTLRFLLLLAVIGAAYPKAREGGLAWQFWLAAGLLAASNVAYHFERTEVFTKLRLSALLFLFDAGVLAWMVVALGERTDDFFILLALTVLLGAIARSVTGAAAATVAVGALYVFLTLRGGTRVEFLSVQFLTRLALLLVLCSFVSFLAHEADRARRSAQISGNLYRNVFEMNPAFLFLCDSRRNILHVNRAVEGGLGYWAHDLRGRRLEEIVEVSGGWQPPVGGNGSAHVDTATVAVLRRDGTRATCRATLAVLPAAAGGLILVQAHERMEKQTIMRRAIVRAEKMAAVGHLVAAVIHELNNLLTSVVGYSQILATREHDAEAQEELGLIEQNAALAARIVKNLRIFTRGNVLERCVFSLNQVVTSVVELKTYDLRPRRIQVEWTPDPTLPDLAGDPHQIGMVVLHLLHNAQQAIEGVPGRPPATIRLRTEARDGGALLEVADDGPGFAPDALPALFEPRAPGEGGGDGMGLSVCRIIVESHGGKIEAASGPGKGATFRITLPAAPDWERARPTGTSILRRPRSITGPAVPPPAGRESPPSHQATKTNEDKNG